MLKIPIRRYMKGAFTIVLAVVLALLFQGCTAETESTECNAESIALPVLMYHGLTNDSARRNRYMISPSLFESDLDYLSKEGYTAVSVSELLSCLDKGASLPEKPVMITFDDGYLNNYTYGFPLLKKYKAKALLSPIGISADEAENEKYRSPEWSQCRWAELEEMTSSGLVELGNHTYDLHHLTAGKKGVTKRSGESGIDYKKRLTQDILTAQNRIHEKTGIRPLAFVYPYGAKSSDTEKIIKDMGFRVIFDCEGKTNAISSREDLYHLHRYIRPDSKSSQEFFRSIGM